CPLPRAGRDVPLEDGRGGVRSGDLGEQAGLELGGEACLVNNAAAGAGEEGVFRGSFEAASEGAGLAGAGTFLFGGIGGILFRARAGGVALRGTPGSPRGSRCREWAGREELSRQAGAASAGDGDGCLRRHLELRWSGW